jgi:hypothetical protein
MIGTFKQGSSSGLIPYQKEKGVKLKEDIIIKCEFMNKRHPLQKVQTDGNS